VNYVCLVCDICRLLVSEAVKHLGGIDILILNAAYSPPPTMFTDYEDPVRPHTLYVYFNQIKLS